ncbi:RNA-binding domain-containing protein [Acinetobacter haemolyticus]|uniref:RNA-binding domain-containing protein n=1 Tax=Acinetobacter haemolyticus TaxID=29430 RepID=UPI0003168E43|nr:RNA-binding domain-containing protein [Acinetobacter haemolyticus]NAR61916.1 AAA family ATPase [Acinetobacter haemolyticus]NAR67500.1 AAA family ATPase [Acinetobacter haemolyticus]NAR70861.1 AAA family ATPase [Acinetobacter haemolyticus]NAR83439.1 AAA family ATPase [Acinetobacter haemolyticus]NAR94077.1 AAA family ATPase [Acinetobacter haemolyticus]
MINSIIQQLEQLIAGNFALLRESVDIECKLAIGQDGKGGLPKSLWETYSAFANTDGGIIILGAKELKNDTFEARGIENLIRIKADLFNTLNNPAKINKNLLTDQFVREWQVDGKCLLVIAVPRASRKQQPIYLNNNPLNNTYVRQNEGDYKLDDEHVKRMLAEQAHDGRDDEILPNFGLDDLAIESLRSYRQRYSNLNPNAELNDLVDIDFLRRIGAYGINRETGAYGLTKAGLLMFGMQHTIAEVFPNYMVDYQERPHAQTEARWVDRVVPDGSWSGNLYDFYRKVYNKLIQDLKIPFELKDGVRQEDTPVHIALREALVNCIVHADYTDRASVLIVKRPDMFGFRNPGLMRIPLEHALKGSESDCRNRKLHQMFRLINVGEQAGSGIPKILSGWHSQHWIPPYLHEKRKPNNQTLLEMTMVDLFPSDTMQQLTQQFGSSFTELTQNERAALAIAKLEGTVTHARLQTVVTGHSVDITRDLQHLVKLGFLNTSGGRGSVYTLAGVDIVQPDDIFNEQNKEISESSSGSNEASLGSNDASLGLKESSSIPNGSYRDEMGRLCSDRLDFPIIDNLMELSEDFRESLYVLANEARMKQRLSLEVMQHIILRLCSEHFFTISALGELLNRKADPLRKRYLSPMVKANTLCLAFPTTPTHEKQAYRTNTEFNHSEN